MANEAKTGKMNVCEALGGYWTSSVSLKENKMKINILGHAGFRISEVEEKWCEKVTE